MCVCVCVKPPFYALRELTPLKSTHYSSRHSDDKTTKFVLPHRISRRIRVATTLPKPIFECHRSTPIPPSFPRPLLAWVRGGGSAALLGEWRLGPGVTRAGGQSRRSSVTPAPAPCSRRASTGCEERASRIRCVSRNLP